MAQYAYGTYQTDLHDPMKTVLLPLNKLADITLVNGTFTTSGNQADSVSTPQLNAAYVATQVTAISGTSPTWQASLQAYNGSTWSTILSLSSLSAAGTTTGIVLLPAGTQAIRAAYTVGGTSPSVTASIQATLFFIGPNA